MLLVLIQFLLNFCLSFIFDDLTLFVCSFNFRFVRFKSLIEAENAILRLNHREIETYRFKIKPAVPKKYPQKTNESFSKPKIPEKSLQHLVGAPLYEGCTDPVLNNSHDVTSLVAGGYEEAATDSDSDCEWDDSLLPMSSINSSDCVSWYDIVTQFNGGVSWDTRTTQLCGNNLAVNIVHNTLLQQDCVYWIQVLESQEVWLCIVFYLYLVNMTSLIYSLIFLLELFYCYYNFLCMLTKWLDN